MSAEYFNMNMQQRRIDDTFEFMYFLNNIIDEGHEFVAFRQPNSETVCVIRDRNTADGEKYLYNVEQLNGRSGYVIAPFAISPDNPAIILNASSVETFNIFMHKGSDEAVKKHIDVKEAASDEYLSHFSDFMAPLHSGQFLKLVLSTNRVVKKPKTFSPVLAFLKLCRANAGSYIYMYNVKPAGLWIGCSPEVLLGGENGEYYTEALAGTCLVSEWKKTRAWDDKEKLEHNFVADYIHAQLLSLGIKPEIFEAVSDTVGHLMHLRTKFQFQLHKPSMQGSIIKALYPTPAVSGSPKDEAVRFILENEGYDRRYYAGFSGMLNVDGLTGLFVSIRCMNVEDKELTLYAGGGLLPASIAKDEWREILYKLQTISSIIS